ncbi:MAG TPA: FtsX-like permease family protein [Kineosporiaceae bacterium]
MRTVVRQELRHGVRRVVAPSLAIMISVAFVTLSFGATAVLKGFVSRAVAVKATRSDLVVTPGEGSAGGLTAATGRTVAAVPGVAHAETDFTRYQSVTWADGEDLSEVASVPADPRLRWTALREGRYPTAPDEAAVDGQTARVLGLHPGARVDLPGSPGGGSGGRQRALTVVGVADLGAAALVVDGRALLMTAAGITGLDREATPDEIDVLIAPGADPVTVRDAVARALGGSAVVRTGQEQADWAAAQLTRHVDVLGGVVLGFAAIALVVATLVISNTFSAIHAQRVRALALLRCVGATRRQVFRSVLAEAAAVGAGGSVLGVAAGVALTAAGVAVLAAFVPAAEGLGLGLAWWMLAVPFGLGVLVALVAAVAPARRATRVAPLAALRPHDAAATRRTSRLRLAAGTIAVGSGTAVLVYSATAHQHLSGLLVGIGGGILTLVGVLGLGPVVVPVAARVVGLPFRGRAAGRIAVGNAVRNPARAAATSVALLVGVSLVTTVSVGAASTTAVAEAEIERHDPVDLVVSASEGHALPAAVAAAVAATPGTRAAATLLGTTVSAPDGHPLGVVSAPDAAFASVWRGADVGPRRSGTALVPGDVAGRLDLRAGATLTLRTGAAGVPLQVRIVPHLPAVVLTGGDLARLGGETTVRQVWLRAVRDVDVPRYRTDVRAAVRGTAGVHVEGSIAERAELTNAVQIMLEVVIGLLAAALVIAVVGIANTLTLSVLERSRELAVQRALGMTRGQLCSSLLVEALVLAGVGTLLGVLLGIGYGWAGAGTLLGGIVPGGVPLVVPWGTVGLTVALAAVTGALAGVLPARRVARRSPTAALAAD